MNALLVYPRPNDKKPMRFGFSLRWLLLATVLSGDGWKITIKDYSCQEFDTIEFKKAISSEGYDIVILECDSFSLKRSENNLHTEEITSIISSISCIPAIVYGHRCCLTQCDFPNATATVKDNDINSILRAINTICDCNINLIDSYDNYPYIDRTLLLDIPYYTQRSNWTLIETSTGCDNSCVFCQRKGWQKAYQEHSIDYVINEFKILKKHSYKNVWVTDENFTLKLERSKRLLTEIIKEKLSEGMKVVISSWTNIDHEFIDLAKEANVTMISFGIESANNDILEFYHKKINLQKFYKLLEYANSKGIFTIGNFIIGAPSETEESIQDTFRYIRQCRFDEVHIKTLDYMLGSELFDQLPTEYKNATHVFACKENGLNNFPLEYLRNEKDDFLRNYNEEIFENRLKKIKMFGTPYYNI